jgi:hypothetical protein
VPEDFVGFGSSLNAHPVSLDLQLAQGQAGSAEELKHAFQKGRLVDEQIFGALMFEDHDGDLRGDMRNGQVLGYELIKPIFFDILQPLLLVLGHFVGKLPQRVRHDDSYHLCIFCLSKLFFTHLPSPPLDHLLNIIFDDVLRQLSQHDSVVARTAHDFIALLLQSSRLQSQHLEKSDGKDDIEERKIGLD